jgi:DNA-binding transcriptional MerR regulator
MRISELARRSGVSVPTIKYYLRTGLLPSGVTTARNQAIYNDAHLRRLRLVRTLREIGGLSVKTTRSVLAALHRSQAAGPEALSIISSGQSRGHNRAFQDALREKAIQELAAVVERRNWDPRTYQRDLNRLADVYVVARLLELPEVCTLTEEYAELATQVARRDVALARGLAARLASAGHSNKALAEETVIALVLSHAMVSALHNIARQAELGRLFAEWKPSEADSTSSSSSSSS